MTLPALLFLACVLCCTNFAGVGGEQGRCPISGAELCYRGCPVHRIVKGFVVQAGDITKGDGTGGTSIYAGTPLGNLWGHFKDEQFLPHHRAGLLSMANTRPNSNR